MRRLVAVSLLVALALAGCGGPPASAREAQRRLNDGDLDGAEQLVDAELARFPKDPTLWNVRIRIHLARRSADRAVAAYREWRELRGADDRGALRAMALTTLWYALASQDAAARAEAISVAERLDETELWGEVSRRLGDDDPVVRATAASALIKGHADAPAILTEALRGDDAAARAIAVATLGRRVGKLARTDIRAALEDEDAGVRAAACTSLGDLADRIDAPLLERMAREDAEGNVRAAALRALARTGADDAGAARAALADAFLGTRLAALAALIAIEGKDARAEVTRLAAADGDPYLALRAGVALAEWGDRAPGTAAVRAALAAKDWTVRAAALNAATDIAAKADAVALVTPLARDPSPETRLAAARALVRLGHEDEATRVFLATASLDEGELKLQAAIDLSLLGHARGPQALGELMAAETPSTRRSAVRAFPRSDALPDPLVGALADADLLVRLAAAEQILAFVD